MMLDDPSFAIGVVTGIALALIVVLCAVGSPTRGGYQPKAGITPQRPVTGSGVQQARFP
jgi:hypothetical protein